MSKDFIKVSQIYLKKVKNELDPKSLISGKEIENNDSCEC